MQSSIAEVTQAAFSLPPEAQEQLAEQLMANVIQSANPVVRRAQLDEVQRRRAEVLSGTVKTIPLSQVKSEVQELLGR